MTPKYKHGDLEIIQRIGENLYGVWWKRPTALLLGIDPATPRHWDYGWERPAPRHARRMLRELEADIHVKTVLFATLSQREG